ncbi:hypothetical protein OIU85_008380 [Salix viminalis]|uniref:Uncharacterized protein n=1 Tax=Salix viminalis TaxID=40686 RepID=A0A9Q0SHB1_SALVM|nr:hypothetical protein OIU85_008380 [Salix viminalis]
MDDLDRGIAACLVLLWHLSPPRDINDIYISLRASDLMDLVCRTCTWNFWDPVRRWPGRQVLAWWEFGNGGKFIWLWHRWEYGNGWKYMRFRVGQRR